MINIKYERNHCGSGMQLMNEREAPGHKAFSALVEAELGWGGKIAKLSETEVVVNTSVLNCQDRSTFTGTAQEMEPLYKVAALYAWIRRTYHKDIVEAGAEVAVDVLKGNPSLISMYSGTLMGLPATKMAIFAYLGFSEEEATTKAGAKLEDLCAAVELHLTEGIAVQEVLS